MQSIQSYFKSCQIYQLNYGIEYLALGLGKVMWYQQNVSTHIATVHVPMWYLAENKEVPDRNIGVTSGT